MGKISGRTVVYVRISSDRTGKEAGVRRQEAECRAIAERLGLTVAHIYCDNDVSAWSGKHRPAFEELMSAAKRGGFDSLIVWRTDRLYRRMVELERIVDDLAAVQIHACMSGRVDLSTADGRLHARMLGAVAQHESDVKSERISAAAKHRRAGGRAETATLPAGFLWADPCLGGDACDHRKPHTPDMPDHPDGEECVHEDDHEPGARKRVGGDKGLVIDPAVAPVVVAAFKDAAGGASLYRVHKRHGKALGLATVTSVRQMLLNPRYAGWTMHHDEIVRDKDGEPVPLLGGQRIVDEELWLTVRTILKDPSRKKIGGSGGRPPVTKLGGGLLRCSVCGYAVVSGGIRDGEPVYVCSKSQCVRRARKYVDGPVLDIVAGWVAGAAERALVEGPSEEIDTAGPLRDEVRELEARKASLAEVFASGQLDAIGYANALKAVQARLDTATAALLEASAGTTLGGVLNAPEGAVAALQALRDDPDPEGLRRVLKGLLVSVVLERDKSITMRWQEWVGLEPTVIPPAKWRRSAVRTTPEGIVARRAKAAEMRAEGLTIQQIADRLGVPFTTINSDLHHANRATPDDDAVARECVELRAMGLTLAQIGEALGISNTTVGRKLKGLATPDPADAAEMVRSAVPFREAVAANKARLRKM